MIVIVYWQIEKYLLFQLTVPVLEQMYSNLFLNALGIQPSQSYSQMMTGMFDYLLSIVFRFHYHSQEVIGIGSLGFTKVSFVYQEKINQM